MIFTDLRLQNYRSYKDSSFELDNGVNIVVGPNAAGKTNLLESLMVSASGKSYRAKDTALISSGSSWSRIDAHTTDNTARTVKLQKVNDSIQKTYEIDEKTLKRLPASKKQPVVLFEPTNMQLLHSEPVVRRDYIDDTIEQYTPGYSELRSKYKRVVAQRNALLKQGQRGKNQIFAWNLRMADIANQLVSKRLELVERINQQIEEVYSSISNTETLVSIKYSSSTNTQDYSSQLLKKLESTVEQDIERGFTGSGPHRDDLVIYFGEQPAHLSASRGEIRTLVLALKIIELKTLEKESGIRPTLLLDDVFSELDGSRRRALTDFLHDYQTIITTTDADVVIQHFIKDYTVIPLARSS
jgi:DNA replication and repair protein RecF